MNSIILLIDKHRNSPIRNVIDQRMGEFDSFKDENSNEIYKEICFCFMTANFNAEKSIKIQNEIG